MAYCTVVAGTDNNVPKTLRSLDVWLTYASGPTDIRVVEIYLFVFKLLLPSRPLFFFIGIRQSSVDDLLACN